MSDKAVTVLIGVGVGLVLIAAVIFTPKILEKTSPQKAVPTLTIIATPTLVDNNPPKQSNPLTIDSPSNNFIANKKDITVSGKTLPDTFVTLIYSLGEIKVKSDKNGLYSSAITLEDGQNKVLATALVNGKVISVEIDIILEIKK